MWRIFLIIVFLVVIGLELMAFFTFRSFLKRKNVPLKWINILTYIPYGLFILPFIFILISGSKLTDLPDWLYTIYIIPFYIFTAANFLIGLYLLVGKIIKLPFSLSSFIINRFDKGKKWLE